MYYDSIIIKTASKFELVKYNCISIIIYKSLLDFIYCRYIANVYAFLHLNVSVINIVNGWLFTLIMVYALDKYYEQKAPSSIIMIALNMIYFVPITTYCGYGGGSSSFLFFAILYWAVLTILQIKVPMVVYERKHEIALDKYIYIVIILVSVFSIYIWGKYTNFRIQTDFLNVYGIRSEASNYNLPSILSYIRQIVSAIIVPMLLLLVMHKRKYILIAWMLFITLINFSYAGNKSIILFPLILIGGYIFYRKNMISLIFPLGILLEIISIIEQKCGEGLIINLFFRRQGVLLAKLSEDYYRFFLENPSDLFRNSIMGKIGFDSIYNDAISKVIGNNFETQIVNCNNGLLADVWSGMGMIGIIVMPIIVIVCFRLLDLVSYKTNNQLIVGFILYYAITFANTTWSTILFTHGFIIMCLVLLLFPREKTVKVEG